MPPIARTVASALVRFRVDGEGWAKVVASCTNKRRATICLNVFAKKLGDIPPEHRGIAELLVRAAGSGRDAKVTEGLVTPIQGARAIDALLRAPAALRARVDGLLVAAKSDHERAVILKGLAARREQLDDAGTSKALAEIAELIRGKAFNWLLAKTTSYESGIKQAFTTSCVPTVKLVAEAESDPLVALRINLDTKNASAADSFAGRYEAQTLERFGGKARPRDMPENRHVLSVLATQLAAKGTKMKEVVPHFWPDLGGKTERHTGATLNAALIEKMATMLREGYDIPMRIGYRNGLKKGHAILAVDCKVEDGKKSVRLYNPSSGKTLWVAASDLFKAPVFSTKKGERYITDVYTRTFAEPRP